MLLKHHVPMSKTIKKTKAAGYEYWTRRPGNICGSSPGRFTKVWTHRAERRQSRRIEYLASNNDFEAAEVKAVFKS